MCVSVCMGGSGGVEVDLFRFLDFLDLRGWAESADVIEREMESAPKTKKSTKGRPQHKRPC